LNGKTFLMKQEILLKDKWKKNLEF